MEIRHESINKSEIQLNIWNPRLDSKPWDMAYFGDFLIFYDFSV